MKYDVRNAVEFKNVCGAELLAFLLKKKQWPLDDLILELCFNLAGAKKGNRTSTFCAGAISNLDIFKTVILDWEIWSRASENVQKLLWESLRQLSQSHNKYAIFNIRRFREAGVSSVIFDVLRQYPIPEDIAKICVSIIEAVMEDPLSTGNIKEITNYLIVSHGKEDDSTEQDLGTGNSLSSSNPIKMSSLYGAPKLRIRKTISFERNQEVSEKQTKLFSPRNLVLAMTCSISCSIFS